MMLSLEGLGLSNGGTSTVAAKGSGASASITDSAFDPVIVVADASKIIDLDATTTRDGTDASVYGGGTVGSPSNTVDVLAMTINGNMNPTPHMGFSGGRDPARIWLDAQEEVTAEIQVEATGVGDFNPYVLRNRAPLEFNFTFVSDESTAILTHTVQVLFYGWITNVTPEDVDGRSVWTLEVSLTYPEDQTQPSTVTAGVKPSQTFQSSVTMGQGLNVDPDESTMPPGMLALQFRTA